MARQRSDWFQKQDDCFDEDEFEQIRQLCRLLDPLARRKPLPSGGG